MDNNDRLIRLRYSLDIKDNDMIEIFKLGGISVTKDEVLKLLIKSKDSDGENNDESIKCTNYRFESFLNGLITFKRGKQEPKPGQSSKPNFLIKDSESTNNVMLKKLKIALSLTSEDMIEIFGKGGAIITKGELSSLFRKEGHKHYKHCGDQYAREFLKGLSIKYRQ